MIDKIKPIILNTRKSPRYEKPKPCENIAEKASTLSVPKEIDQSKVRLLL